MIFIEELKCSFIKFYKFKISKYPLLELSSNLNPDFKFSINSNYSIEILITMNSFNIFKNQFV